MTISMHKQFSFTFLIPIKKLGIFSANFLLDCANVSSEMKCLLEYSILVPKELSDAVKASSKSNHDAELLILIPSELILVLP